MAGAVEDAAAAMPDKPKKRSSPEGPDVPVAAAKQAKPTVDERAFVVQEGVKSLGHKIVRQQAGAVSRISVVPGAPSKLLCVITNDVVAAKRRMEENGNKELFIVSATVLQVSTLSLSWHISARVMWFAWLLWAWRGAGHGARRLPQRAL
tara:strand:- start:978 stop:1427 length:450 start_codon:yes stop_codon:yes gene_type:complete